MEKGKEGLDDLAKEIEKLIQGNKKFLDKMMDEEFDAEEDLPATAEQGESEDFEEL